MLTVTIGTAVNVLTTLRMTIGGLTNPSSTQPTATFSVSSYTDGAVLVESSQISSNPTLTATADTISVTSFVSTSNIVGEVTAATLSFTTKNAIPTNGQMTLTFPAKWNPSAPAASQLSYF